MANRPVRDIFGEKISVFWASKGAEEPIRDPNTRHYERTIAQFLDAGIMFADEVQHVRDIRARAFDAYQQGDMGSYESAMEQYRTEKARPPFAILQGVCPARNNTDFESYSNVLCLDIDAPKPTETSHRNSWVKNWGEVKATISQLPFVSYVALSSGGAGLFVLIPIADHTKHEDYFEALCRVFEDCFNLELDKKCRNMGRLRFMTYDPAPYINHNAEVWDSYDPKPRRKQRDTSPRWGMQRDGAEGCSTLSSTDKERVKWCVGWCLKHGTDIADDFDDWTRLAGFFAHQWNDGEGESLFHELAALSPKYNVRENDKKLVSMGRYHPHPATIHTFYRLCRSHGVPVPDGWGRETRGFSWDTVTSWVPVSRSSRERAERNDEKVTGEEQARNTPISPVNDPVSAFEASSGIVTPPPEISATERNELERHRADIVTGCSTIERMRRDLDGFDALMDGFNLDFAGLNDWTMTPAQVLFVSQNYSNFVTQ